MPLCLLKDAAKGRIFETLWESNSIDPGPMSQRGVSDMESVVLSSHKLDELERELLVDKKGLGGKLLEIRMAYYN